MIDGLLGVVEASRQEAPYRNAQALTRIEESLQHAKRWSWEQDGWPREANGRRRSRGGLLKRANPILSAVYMIIFDAAEQ
jgi:hypothetical protein